MDNEAAIQALKTEAEAKIQAVKDEFEAEVAKLTKTEATAVTETTDTTAATATETPAAAPLDVEAELLALKADFDKLLGLVKTYGFTVPLLREVGALVDTRKAAQVQPAALDTTGATGNVSDVTATEQTGTDAAATEQTGTEATGATATEA